MPVQQATPSKNRRLLLWVLLATVICGAVYAWRPLQAIYFSGVPGQLADPYLTIPSGSSFEQVVERLKTGGFINNEESFRWLAEKMKYKRDEMRAGRFKINENWSNRDLIRHLRGGEQAPVKVVLTNERLPEEVAGKVARFIEADSLSILQAILDPARLADIGYNPQTVMTLFIPNTYEMYWNTDADAFLKRMIKEKQAFWDKNNRMAKANALNLTPEAVYTVASIVERETNADSEKPTIAGVYLNRLRIGMKLQADPTCVFATRDFATKRVTQYHTTFDSPYNTYMYTGLPPGPISMASIPSIDAVLNPEKHDYLYFCAKPDDSGTHAFASTLSGHNVNVDKFRVYMRQKGL